MFDLEHAIAEWRCRMAVGGLKSRELLDELENHLRDDIERQMRLGASEREGYDAAVARLGGPAVLQSEFAKVAGGHGDRRRKFLRVSCLVTAAFVLLINTWTLQEYELDRLERLLGLCVVTLVGLYLAWLPVLFDSLSYTARARLARVIKFASIFVSLFPVFALLQAERVIHWDPGIVVATILWCVYAALAITLVLFALNHSGLQEGGAGGTTGGTPPLQPQPWPIPKGPNCPPEVTKALSGPKPVDPIVHQSLELARHEASRLGQDFVGTEHVLLGLLKLAQGPFAKMLSTLKVDREVVRIEIERLIRPAAGYGLKAPAPLTPRASKAIRLAARQAKVLNYPYLGAEHLFLGLLLEGSGIAAKVLKNLGIRFDESRQAALVSAKMWE